LGAKRLPVKDVCLFKEPRFESISEMILLPIRDLDEIGSRAVKRLIDSHRQSHADGEFRDTKVRELVRRAAQMFGRLLPSGSASGAAAFSDS
jgi:hypothetical protein